MQTRVLAGASADQEADVVVLGAGASGVAAAVAAARHGLRTVLVEAGTMPGGELATGMAIDGAFNGRGERVLGGVGRELIEDCRSLGGFAEALNDHHLIWYVCIDPEVMKLAAARRLARAGVQLLLHTVATAVETEGQRMQAVHVLNKSGRTRIAARYFIDCSGDADLVRAAGGEVVQGGPGGELQPVSLMFRMSGVQTAPLLQFQAAHPSTSRWARATPSARAAAMPSSHRPPCARGIRACSSKATGRCCRVPSPAARCTRRRW